MEYFNTETTKFQTPVSTCQISDGPGFGPKVLVLIDVFDVPNPWWSTCYILQTKLQINVQPNWETVVRSWRCNLFNHLRVKKLTQCTCCCENYKVIRNQNYWLKFSFPIFSFPIISIKGNCQKYDFLLFGSHYSPNYLPPYTKISSLYFFGMGTPKQLLNN